MTATSNATAKRLIQLIIAGLLFLSLASCQKVDDSGADTVPIQESILGQDVLAAELLSKIAEELIAAGFSRDQILKLQQGTENGIRTKNLVTSEEIGKLTVETLKGTLLTIPQLNLSDDATREKAVVAVATALTKCLNGHATGSSSVRGLFSLLSDIFDPGNSYLEILESLATVTVQYLDEAGIGNTNVFGAVTSVNEAITANLSAAGVGQDMIETVTKAVVKGSIGALDEAGVTTAQLESGFQAVISGALVGLKNSGLDSTALQSAAVVVTQGAIVGLYGLNVDTGNLDGTISNITDCVNTGLGQAGLDATAIVAVEVQILEASWDGKSELLNNERPKVSDKAETFAEDNPTVLDISGTDPENAGLNYRIITAPANGTLSEMETAPNLTYTPNPNYFGPDQFSYRANDGM
ncbi:MAG: hypothetical protein GY866_22575, partial [Proteobacteria bacterium]|nr:hypothetical protein [Pseudomonadota bacterium]